MESKNAVDIHEESSEYSIPSAIADIAFPNCSEDVKKGIITPERARQIMLGAVEKFYPDCVYAFGHGSALTGGYQAYSDLDVIVFVSEPDYWEMRHEMFDGFPIEFTAYSVNTVDLMAFMAIQVRMPLGLLAADGEILVDTDNSARAFQARLSLLANARQSSDFSSVTDKTREQILLLLVDLYKNRPIEVAQSVVLTAYPILIRGITLLHNVWQHRTKLFAKQPNLPGASEIMRLHEAIGDLMNGDVKPVIAFSEKLLEDLGGGLWSGRGRRQIVKAEFLPVAQMLLGLDLS